MDVDLPLYRLGASEASYFGQGFVDQIKVLAKPTSAKPFKHFGSH